MDTPGKRITKWREYLKMKPRDFAKETGIPYTTLMTIESDSNKPSYDVLSKLRKTFPQLNIDWVFDEGGEEPMLKEDRNLVSIGKQVHLQGDESQDSMTAETNPDINLHRYNALLELVTKGFFGSPEQMLKGLSKKARASSNAAGLFELVDAVATEYPNPFYEELGFKQAGRQRQLA